MLEHASEEFIELSLVGLNTRKLVGDEMPVISFVNVGTWQLEECVELRLVDGLSIYRWTAHVQHNWFSITFETQIYVIMAFCCTNT